MIKYYITGLISIIAAFFYYLPWISATHKSLGFYIIAFFWFLIAWIILLMQLYICFYPKFQKTIFKKHLIISSVMIIVSYIVVLIGVKQGYVVTV